MKEFLRKIKEFFASEILVDSLDEFTTRIKKENCKLVTIVGVRAPKDTHISHTIGAIGTFQYLLEFASEMPNKKKIIFSQINFEQYGSEKGLSDYPERQKAAIKNLLMGEAKVKELKGKLLNLTIELIGPNGRVMDEKIYEQLHRDAAKYSVTV